VVAVNKAGGGGGGSGSASFISGGGVWQNIQGVATGNIQPGDFVLITSRVADAGTNVAHVLDTTAALTGTTLLASFRNAAVEKASIADDGTYATGGVLFGTGQNGYYGYSSGVIIGGPDGTAAPLIWLNRGVGNLIDLLTHATNQTGIRLHNANGGMRSGGSWSVDPTQLLCVDGSDGSVGDSGYKKSAASGGNMSALYDNAEFDRYDGTNRRFLAAAPLLMVTAIGDANGTTSIGSATMGFGAGGGSAIDATLTRTGARDIAMALGGVFQLRGGTSGTIGFAPAPIITDHALTWPAAQGAANTVLTNDGAGALSWAAASADANFQFLPAQNEPPLTDPATFTTIVAATGSRPLLEFDGTTDESGVMSGILRNYRGGGVTVTFRGTMDTANAGTKVVKLACSFEKVQSGDVLGAGGNDFAAAETVEITVNNTAGTMFEGTLAFTNGAQMDSLVTGNSFRFKITRNNAGLAGTNATGRYQLMVAVCNNT
jgi:hypothetical protein